MSLYLQSRADVQLVSQLDQHGYNEQDLVEIRIPLHLPYITNTDHFERCDGQIEVDGRSYSYVKRKVQNDSLVLLCIRNEQHKKFTKARNNYFGLVNGLGTSTSQQKAPFSFFKTLLTEYQPEPNCWSLSSLTLPHPSHFSPYRLHLASADLNTPEYPPELG